MDNEVVTSECIACQQNIVAPEESVKCDGVCGKEIHTQCAFLNTKEVKIINQHENIQYICDICITFSLRTMNNKINGIYEYLYNIDKRTQAIIEILNNKNKPTIKTGAGQISINERRNTIINTTEKKSKPNETNKSTKTNTTTRESVTKQIEHTKNRTEATSNMQHTKSYAAVAARTQKNNNNAISKNETKRRENKTNENKKNDENKTVNKKVNVGENKNEKKQENDKLNTIIIKPKKIQESNETINDLNKKFKPSDLAINRIIKMRNGIVKISCDTNDKLNLIKDYIENEMKDRYDIVENKLLMPRIKICGLTEKWEIQEIEQQMKRQNGTLVDSELQVLKVTEDIKNKGTFNAIIKIDKHSFNEIIKKKKVMINWDCCSVKEHLSLVRCHKCSGFNHTKDICKNKTACGYCGDDHESTKCESENMRCINCIVANEKYTMNLNTNHHVWSKQCEILSNKLNKIKKKTEYETELQQTETECAYFNAQGITTNINQLKIIIQEINAKIICLSETHLTKQQMIKK